jgi:hypothetical protein
LRGEVDEGFISRSYRTAFFVFGAILAYGAAARWDVRALTGLVIGFTITVGSFWLLQQTVRALAQPERPGRIGLLVGLSFLKLGLIGAALYVSLLVWKVNPIALAGGAAILTFVMFCKGIGRAVIEANKGKSG